MKTCSVEGCDDEGRARGLCDRHYSRWRRHGDPLGGKDGPVRRRKGGCSVEGCERWHYGRGYCLMHYDRWYRHGDPLHVSNGGEKSGPRNIKRGYRADGVFYSGESNWGKPCKVEGCGEGASTFGLCQKHAHYARFSDNEDFRKTYWPQEAMASVGRCSLPDCDKLEYAKGYCRKHHARLLRTGSPRGNMNNGEVLPDGTRVCKVTGCLEDVLANGLCRVHYDAINRMRDPESVRRRISKAIATLERYAGMEELWPEDRSPEDLLWVRNVEERKHRADEATTQISETNGVR